MTIIKKHYYKLGAAMTAGAIVASAAPANAAGLTTFSTIAQNIQVSTQSIPGLLTALAYLFGILLGVLGIMKIKDHVENPSQTPLKDGAIRLAAGGALFALPIVFDSMFNTVDNGTGGTTTAAQLKKAKFNIAS